MRFLFWEIKRLPAVVKAVVSKPATVAYKRNGEQIHRLLYPGDTLELDFDPIPLTQTEQKIVDSMGTLSEELRKALKTDGYIISEVRFNASEAHKHKELVSYAGTENVIEYIEALHFNTSQLNAELAALRNAIDEAFDFKKPCDDAKRIKFATVCYEQAGDYESIKLHDFVTKMSKLLGIEEKNYNLFFKSCLEIVNCEVKDSKELVKKLEKKSSEVEQLELTLKLCDQKNINAANEMYARISRDGLLNFIKSSL